MEKGSCSRNPNRKEEVPRVLGSVSHPNADESNDSNQNQQVVNVEARCSSKRPQRFSNPNSYVGMISDEEMDNDDGDVDFEINERGSNSARKTRTPDKRRKNRRRTSTLSARNIEGLTIQETQTRSIVSWLIDSETVSLNANVCYVNWSCGKWLFGNITREGILCNCCQTIFTISGFEAHSGFVTDHPFQKIFVDTKTTLFHCQMTAWNKLQIKCRENHPIIKYEGDSSDDTCGVCGDGGDLLCCDKCPSTFHQNCLGIEVVPQGNWYCPLCLCKYCGMIGNRGKSLLLRCRQCEQKFHHVCIREEKARTPWDHNGFAFCGKSCSRLFEHLQNLVGIKIPLRSGITWSLIRSFDHDLITFGNGLYKRMQYNSTLAAALAVLEECFDPIIDCRTGINVIKNIVCNNGSYLRRLNFGGFYTAVLERGDEILSVASIRIHGTRLGEMPFIGTRNKFRCQGLCRLLLKAIESRLRTAGVEKMIIPSIADRVDKWMNSYGFKHIEKPLKLQIRTMNLLTFPGTIQLQKVLLMNRVNDSANRAAVGDAEVRINNRLLIPLPFDLNQPFEEEEEEDESAKNELDETFRPTHGVFIVFNPHDGTIRYRRVRLQY